MESGSGRTLLFIGRRPPVYFNEEPLLLHLWFSTRSICRLVLLVFSLNNLSLQLTHYIKRKCDITQTKQSPSQQGCQDSTQPPYYIGSDQHSLAYRCCLPSLLFLVPTLLHQPHCFLSTLLFLYWHWNPFLPPPLPHQTADSPKNISITTVNKRNCLAY